MKYFVLLTLALPLAAQEASSGFELSGTMSVEAFDSQTLSSPSRDGSNVSGGFRLMLYPVWKISNHWSVSAALQLHSRPYFYDEFSTRGYGVNGDVLQASLNYSQVFDGGSITFKAGELSSAFGSFLLRYDDAVNPLIDRPLMYGYYSEGVTTLSLAGAEADATLGKFDARLQLVNSSLVNRRSIFDRDQYGNWAGGAGYTIVQGLRVGASVDRGPYLDRQSPYFFPGEAPPNQLPATAVGIDANWGRGPWNTYGEWQHFQMDYHVIPDFVMQAGYVEAKRTLTPRWFVAARLGYTRSIAKDLEVYEIGGAYRPNRIELMKLSYEMEQGPRIRGTTANTLALQFVTTFGPWTTATSSQ